MIKKCDVEVEVISQQGICAEGHKVGDKWIISSKSPEGICLSALHTLLPNYRTLRFGGLFPWSDDPSTTKVACPDGKNPVIFELRRLSGE